MLGEGVTCEMNDEPDSVMVIKIMKLFTTELKNAFSIDCSLCFLFFSLGEMGWERAGGGGVIKKDSRV